SLHCQTHIPLSLTPLSPSTSPSSPSPFALFFFNDPATTEIYTLSLHDALPISSGPTPRCWPCRHARGYSPGTSANWYRVLFFSRSEEHTSELQSRSDLVCRLLLEKKKTANPPN